jgi:hypothetical protein
MDALKGLWGKIKSAVSGSSPAQPPKPPPAAPKPPPTKSKPAKQATPAQPKPPEAKKPPAKKVAPKPPKPTPAKPPAKPPEAKKPQQVAEEEVRGVHPSLRAALTASGFSVVQAKAPARQITSMRMSNRRRGADGLYAPEPGGTEHRRGSVFVDPGRSAAISDRKWSAYQMLKKMHGTEGANRQNQPWAVENSPKHFASNVDYAKHRIAAVLVHEMAHHTDFRGVGSPDPEIRGASAALRKLAEHRKYGRAPGSYAPSNYAKTNSYEYVAELHTAYVMQHSKLKADDPAGFAAVRAVRAAWGMPEPKFSELGGV